MLENWPRVLLCCLIGGTLSIVGIDYIGYVCSPKWLKIRVHSFVGTTIRGVYLATGAPPPTTQMTQFNRIGFGFVANFIGIGTLVIGIGNLFSGTANDLQTIKPGYQWNIAPLVSNPTIVTVCIALGLLLGLAFTRRCGLIYRVLASVIAVAFAFSEIASASYHVGNNAEEWFALGTVLAVAWALVVRVANVSRKDPA